MVLCGGLELVAAGYVLHEIQKNDKRAKSEEREKRRKKKNHHQPQQHNGNRPSRPPTQSLLPPANPGWGRPSSAPPAKMRPQRPPQGQLPWHGQPQHPQQNPASYPKPTQTSTWPAQARPPTMAEQRAWYGPLQHQQQRPPQPQPQPPHQQRPPPPPPGPGMLNHAPTMHFDTKTGKWQTNMLPADMQPTKDGRRSLPDVAPGDETAGRERAMSTPPQPPPRPLRQESGSSLSSVPTGSDSSDSDEALAYGKAYRKGGRPTKVLSHERQRPLAIQHGPVELDWYATQRQRTPQPTAQQQQQKQAQPQASPQMQMIQRATTPNIALAMMNRDHRAVTMPVHAQQYSMSQPNLLLPTVVPGGPVELDGTSAGAGGKGGRMAMQGRPPAELEGNAGYRAYTGAPS